MNKQLYNTLLKDKRWAKKRRSVLKRDKHRCTNCSSKECLQVHHLYYIKNRSPWDYSNDALVTLCSICHEDWHAVYKAEIRLDEASKKYEPPKKAVKKRDYSYLRKKKKKDKGYKIPRSKLKSARKFLY